ncbi:DUF1269 domain-containing protein [Dictyobacter formicarum]|uniref:Uncharacterized protein n=1 Tax=Dictyobacter formicarum TaxID=2778368 RepID=A0ABQ3VNY5_9CHLR|nr:DUF1269 domain-containing protein [Dictyobacter formicarum]GHO87381.1 hypothetical protein KSZ_53870 [Dictyobacter formicarum]
MADSTMIVLLFDDERGAERLFDEFEETLKDESFPIDDAAVVTYKQTGELLVKQWSHPLSENGFTSELWTFVIKTLLSGLEYHIDDWFIEKFKQVFQSGSSALFCLIEPSASREILIQFRQFRGTLIYAGFTEEQKVQLKAAASAGERV